MPLYNEVEYNSSNYNVNTIAKLLEDITTLTDLRGFQEVITLSDAVSFYLLRTLSDYSILLDDLTKEVTDKRLTDTLTLKNWIIPAKRPQSDSWYN